MLTAVEGHISPKVAMGEEGSQKVANVDLFSCMVG